MQAEKESSLAALILAAARGRRLTDPDRETLRGALIRMKKNGNVSWTVIGSVYGLSGPQMRRVRKVLMAARPGRRDT